MPARAADAMESTTHTTDATVSLEGVVVEYQEGNSTRRRRVLDDISLSVPEGEFFVLVGKSGCGKTTLLNLLTGLVQPDAGTVRVLGKSPLEARRETGYMFARDALIPWRSAVSNVEFGLEVQGVDRQRRREVASQMLSRLGLADALHHLPGQLSQGMRQRVALARTWAVDPAVLLMDEPFAALDAQTKVQARAEFISVWEERRRTVVYVTHDLSEAVLLGDRIVMLNEGGVELDVRVPFSHPRDTEELMYTSDFRDFERYLWSRLR